MKLSRLAALLVLATLSTASPARAAPIDDPVTIKLLERASLEQVALAVKRSLARREWEIVEEKPGLIQAVLERDDETYVYIDIAFDTRRVKILYLDSEGLDFDESRGEINGRYNKWLRYLTRQIDKELAEIVADAPPPPRPAKRRVGEVVAIGGSVAVRSRPAVAQAPVAKRSAPQPATLKAPVHNADGDWWYVEGGVSGWVLDGDLPRPAPRHAK